MSYDISLWQQSASLEAEEVYTQLSDGQAVDGLVPLPIDEIMGCLRKEFPGIEENPGTLDWDSPDNKGAVQVSWSPQHVRFDCYGLSTKYMKKLTSVAREFGLPVYDPQRNVRYETDPKGREQPPSDG